MTPSESRDLAAAVADMNTRRAAGPYLAGSVIAAVIFGCIGAAVLLAFFEPCTMGTLC